MLFASVWKGLFNASKICEAMTQHYTFGFEMALGTGTNHTSKILPVYMLSVVHVRRYLCYRVDFQP